MKTKTDTPARTGYPNYNLVNFQQYIAQPFGEPTCNKIDHGTNTNRVLDCTESCMHALSTSIPPKTVKLDLSVRTTTDPLRGPKLGCHLGIYGVPSMLLFNQFRDKPEQEPQLLLWEGLMLCSASVHTSTTLAEVWFTETRHSVWDLLHPINNDAMYTHQVLDIDCLRHVTENLCKQDS